jgi:N utilization substance protein B
VTGRAGDARHRARERALEILYEASIKQVPPHEVVAALPSTPDEFVVGLVANAEQHRDQAEEAIRTAATDWPLERLAIIDRLVMVLAIGELLGEDPPPDAVVLDEAVELAKTFSTDASPRFVNGVLAAVLPTLARGG